MMVQIKLSQAVVYIFAAAAIAPVVVNGLPLPGKKNKFEDPKSGMIEGEILHTDLRMRVG